MHIRQLTIATLLLLLTISGSVFASAGVFQFVRGDVRLIDANGIERTAIKGDALNEGDSINTGGDAMAQINMADGGFISVRPNTKMKVDTYIYAGKNDSSEKSFFSLLVGGFRSLTGLIGKHNKENYKIKTPSATIGVRGTDHEPMVILPEQSALGKPGTYDKVNFGASFITNDKGIININPNQVGFVPSANTVPVILPKIPSFYRHSPPIEVRKAIRPEESVGRGGADDKVGDVQSGQVTTAKDAVINRDKTVVAPVRSLTTSTGIVPLKSSLLLAPLPSLSTTTKLAPLSTSTQPLTTTITTTKTLDPLAVPTTTSTTTTDPTLKTTTTTLQPVLSTTTTLLAPTTTTTLIQPVLSPKTTTTLIQPVLSPTTTTTLIQPVLSPTTTIQPILSPTTTMILQPKILP